MANPLLSSSAQAAEINTRNPGHLKMALVNMRSEYTDSADAERNRKNLLANINRHMYFIDRVAAEGAEFIGFPEASINGYRYSVNMTWLKRTGPEVQAFQDKAKQKKVYISAGLAEEDENGRRWETQFVVDPQGKVIAWQRKHWLTAEQGFTESATDFSVFEIKGARMGIVICADGTNFDNLKALVHNGAQIIYAPHCNLTGSTTAGWYEFRSRWAGKANREKFTMRVGTDAMDIQMPVGGWINLLNVHAALHNHAGIYNAEYNPPPGEHAEESWASGAWFIGPDGETLAQMPVSTDKNDSKEYILTYNIPLTKK